MGRGSSARRRSPRSREAPPASPGPGVGLAPAPTLAAATLARVWNGVGYRPLADATTARALFDFAAVPWPEDAPALAWGAFAAAGDGERLVGAVLAEAAEGAMMLHGPVVVAADEPLEIASQLVAAALDHAVAANAGTLFARPQGLDRIWVRFGFIPLPENTLPPALRGRPDAGLYAWRGGSALWSLREGDRD